MLPRLGVRDRLAERLDLARGQRSRGVAAQPPLPGADLREPRRPFQAVHLERHEEPDTAEVKVREPEHHPVTNVESELRLEHRESMRIRRQLSVRGDTVTGTIRGSWHSSFLMNDGNLDGFAPVAREQMLVELGMALEVADRLGVDRNARAR